MKKLNDYDLLKVFAVILVVFAHVTRMYTGQGVVNPINGSIVLNYITKYIYSFHMPLFVAVSGAIYYYLRQEKGKYNNSKEFIKNKAKRLLIPYIVFGTLYVSPIMVGFSFTKENLFHYFINDIILSKDARHLWYVFMLFNAFIIVYFIEKHVNKLPKWLSIAGVFFVYLLSAKLPSILQIKNTTEYLIYFYLGYLFQANKNILVSKLKFNTITVVIAFILNVITLYLSINIHTKWFVIYSIDLCSAILGMITLYSIINILLNTNIFNTQLYRELKQNSFGIYLFHPMIIYVLFYYLGSKNINPFILTGLVFIVSMILSDLFTRLVRIVNLGIIIGENKREKVNINVDLKSA